MLSSDRADHSWSLAMSTSGAAGAFSRFAIRLRRVMRDGDDVRAPDRRTRGGAARGGITLGALPLVPRDGSPPGAGRRADATFSGGWRPAPAERILWR